MSVKPHPTKGEGWWYIDYWPNGRKGKRERVPFKGAEAEARQLEIELRRQSNKEVPVSPYIRDVLPEFLEHYKNRVLDTTIEDFIYSWKQLTITFGNVKFNHLTRGLIDQYKTRRSLEGVKKRTISKELTYLRVLVKWSADNNHCAPLDFQIDGYSKKFTRPPLPDVPTAEEMRRLLDVISPERRLIPLLLYHAGLRRAEACTLKRQDVYLDRGVIVVKGKGKKQRIIPIISNELMGSLKQAMNENNGTEYLSVNPKTGQPYNSIRKLLSGAEKRAGLRMKVTHHLLRHAFGTHGAEAGVDPRTMQKNLGHSRLDTTMIYTHIAAAHQKLESEKLGNLFNSK